MDRRQWLRIAGGGVVVAATAPVLSGCSSDLPAEAVAAWQAPSAELDLRRWVLSHALLAPHAHNLQSWVVDLPEPDTMVLRMDMARLLPETDPLSRQMVISQGTFLELLDMAARQRGHRAVITTFPEGSYGAQPDARPTAHIRLVPDTTVSPDPLFAQVFKRHTHRGAYEARDPSPEALKAMGDSVAAWPVTLGWVTRAQGEALREHGRIAMAAWQTELVTPRTLLESYHLLRIGPTEIAQHRDGIALNRPDIRLINALGLFDRSKASAPDSSEIKEQLASFNQNIASTPAYVWIRTAANDRSTQLQAGRAYVRLQLAATAHGLSMHPLSQALQEYPEQLAHYDAAHRLMGGGASGHTVQMWTRLGYASTPGTPSPRRGLEAQFPAASSPKGRA
ncbi:Acg family FMN-binding oxidoreductase [Ideonella sp.]|jgi:hypothetical protein|uniref:Acg family FMN-binding oxidoreductase n=1 Tax=Ideonella sp. TaxID=1929293 RepID=UPI0037C1968B